MAETEVLDKKAAKKAEKAQKKEEKKKRKEEKKNQAAEGLEEEQEESGGKLVIVLVTFFIVVIWLGIFAMLIRLDVGGFGSTILYPVLKDVPYVNKILPEKTEGQGQEETAVDVQYPYSTLDEAIARIKELELELSAAQEVQDTDTETVGQLEAEVNRLKAFEEEQAAFQELKTKFYEEVVFSDNAPDISEYMQFYEGIDAANAAELYKQAVQQEEEDAKLKEYAKTYASMKPKQAAAIMEQMTDNLSLVAEILENMDVSSRASILGAMSSDVAAKVTKLMKPKEP